MKQTFYSTNMISEFSLNACHSELCKRPQRLSCEKSKRCHIRLCGRDQTELFGEWEWNDGKSLKKRQKKEGKWRRAVFKKCKPVVFSIIRGV